MQRHLTILWLLLAMPSCATGAAPRGKGVPDRAAQLQREASAVQLAERGRGFAAVGDLTRAEQYFSASLDAGADARTVLPQLLRVCVAARRYRVGVEHARRYLREDPSDDRLRFLLGVLEAAVGDRDAALRELQVLLENHPDDAEGHYALAVLLRDQADDVVDADAHFRAYIRLSPEGAHAADARASLLKEP